MTIRRFAELVLPGPVHTWVKQQFLSRQARRLRADLEAAPLAQQIDIACDSPYFKLDQKHDEFRTLLEDIARLRPRILCEIGGRAGGSLALFAQVADPQAKLLSVDIDYRPGQKDALAEFAREGQRVTCIAGDSHSAETVSRVRQWLGGAPVDFLFIDGDHSYAGVKQDFELFAPFVRSGGLIAFHDIVPDFKTRNRGATASDTGEVPRYWKELRASALVTDEYVDDWDQDGFGIGVVRWSSAVAGRA